QTARSQIKARGGSFVSPAQIKTGDQVTRIGDVPTLAPYTVVSVDAAAATVTLDHPEISLPNPTVPISEVSLIGQGTPQNNPWSTGSLNDTAQLQELHELLIDPIAHWLPQDPEAQVIFIPQEQLFLVPFPALKNATGQFLIEQHTISTAPAIQVLGLTRQTATSNAWQQSPLVVGNPSPMPAAFAALPFAEQEAQEIAPILSTQPLLQAMATESAVKQQISQASLIHLATHGFFNETQPLQGALALAPVAQQDGLLTADEISNLSLRAELVVLSACDTGRGRITGDGVIGLSRAFLGAGANSVMASLWQVADDSTAVLMVAFYQQLVQGQTKSQALRQAMLATMESHPDPHDWAAFTVIGAPE
ncbi:MAG: CHAT domain-containing protein, partial [Cyanobacteria bacterium P01_G01_bin.38]